VAWPILAAALLAVNACASAARIGPASQDQLWRAYLGSARRATAVAESVLGDPQPVWRTDVGRGVVGAPALTEDVVALSQVDRQVALLDRTDCFGVPFFLTPYFQANVLQLPVTNIIPGITYRLLASTNLADWSGIQTSTPPADPALFTDPKATNYMDRFYRLVTP